MELRALAEIHGKPMLQYVIEGLRSARSVSRVVVVGSEALRAVPGVDELIPDTGSMTGNLGAGLQAFGAAEYVLVSTTDIPMVTGEAIDDYIARGRATDAAVCYCAIPRADNERVYPGMRRTYVTVRDGVFTGGNVVLLKPEVYPKLERVLDTLYRARKNPLKLAALIGPGILFRLVLKRLWVRQAEARALQLVGAPIRLVISPYPQLGADVDKPDDLEAVRHLAGLPRAGAPEPDPAARPREGSEAATPEQRPRPSTQPEE